MIIKTRQREITDSQSLSENQKCEVALIKAKEKIMLVLKQCAGNRFYNTSFLRSTIILHCVVSEFLRPF